MIPRNTKIYIKETVMNVSVIIPAAGSGTRAKLNENKIFFNLGEKTVIEKTVDAFKANEQVTEIVIACSENDEQRILALFSDSKKVKTVIGGKTRTESVKNALNAASGEITLVHDGARPFVTNSLVNDIIEATKQFGAAIPVIFSTDTLGFGENGFVSETTRQNLYFVQTPQGFSTEKLKLAYSRIKETDVFTDDAGVYCKYVGKVKTVDGEKSNKKLTYHEDFIPEYLVGTGFDLHRLVENRPLILGGVHIPHDKGLLGHSDADVLTHAVMDAILSALSLRDIGYHFPDTDPKYSGADSMLLLREVLEKMHNRGYKVNNLSACIMAEKPKLKQFVPAITQNLAAALSLSHSLVGITCTTLEKIGTVGREEGIAVEAYVCLKRADA